MKQYVLVAGLDYEFKGVDFRLFCNNRAKRIILANRKKEDLRFIIYDFAKGEVLTHEVTYPSGKKVEKLSSTTPFKPVGQSNYDRTVVAGTAHYKFKDGQRGLMSVLDIYQAVRQIGKGDPGTLVELSFFSHAWHGGPIMVNSYDNGVVSTIIPPATTPVDTPLPAGARDPDDFDPRIKDFTAPTMDAAALAEFKKAFATDGYVWIWGCAFPRVVHEILHKVENHPSYKTRGLDDKKEFTFKNFRADHADVLETYLRPELGGPFPDRKKIVLKFELIKLFICRVTTAAYTHHIAVAAGVKAFGGVMGTYSEYDTGPLPLMNVYKNFGPHFTFYKNYMGFSFDPEGRRYGLYKPGFACVAPSP